MAGEPQTLNDGFGVLIEDVTRQDLYSTPFRETAYKLWFEHRGLVAIRGNDLAELEPEDLVAWANVFGAIDQGQSAGRTDFMVRGHPILRIGNVRDQSGELCASFAKVPTLTNAAEVRYNPETSRPVWHTDSVFRQQPPIGSVFHCRIAPPSGGETLFADMRGAFASLDELTKTRLRPLEAVCSFAHHDKKISLYSPGYPTLTPAERAENPPNRVPIVLDHPVSGEPALYGLNSSTCAIVAKGEPISEAQMDVFDLEGIEDESVMILRDLLPHITGPEFTVCWDWRPGDIVTWDNRSTMHAATGYDDEHDEREMWRLTLMDRTS